MRHVGLEERAWTRLLHSDSLPVRLYALRTLPVEALLREPPGRLYPWLWAVARQATPEQVSWTRQGAPVRALIRWQRRAHRWKAPRSRSECAQALVEAVHPQQILGLWPS